MRTLCTMPSSTERTCITLAPSEASSSISSNAILSSRRALRHDARIGGVDAVDVGVDVAAVGADGGRHRHRRGVGAAAAERGDAPGLLVQALEAGDDRDLLAFAEAPDDFGAVDVEDAGRGMRVRGQDRQLPALPGARVDVHVLQRDGEQAGGHLLAGGDHGVVFAGVEYVALLQGRRAPGDQLVGGARHGRDDDGDVVAGVDLALDVARDVADAVDVGDRGAAELHDETGHGSRSRSSTASAPVAAMVAGRREKARIDTGAMRRLQLRDLRLVSGKICRH